MNACKSPSHLQGPEAQLIVPRAGEREEKSPAVTAVHSARHPTQKRELKQFFCSTSVQDLSFLYCAVTVLLILEGAAVQEHCHERKRKFGVD